MYSKTIPILLLLAACWPSIQSARAVTDDDPLKDPQVQKALRAMGDASTWYHPDLFGEFAGMRHYAHHDYKGALKYFKTGAYYADKLSQMSLGLMYANGEGVQQDLLTAYAWLSVAAERSYPEFVATRDRIKAELSPQQLQAAGSILADIQSHYGDAVAKPRMAQQLRFGMEQITGSHTGFDFGVAQVATSSCAGGATVLVGGIATPKAGCGGSNLYAPERWEPNKYFALRDTQWKATVSVGAIKDISAANAPEASSDPSSKSASDPGKSGPDR